MFSSFVLVRRKKITVLEFIRLKKYIFSIHVTLMPINGGLMVGAFSGLWIELSAFYCWAGTMGCVLGEDT